MNRAIISALLSLMIWMCAPLFGAPLRFEKVSDHCYYLQLKGGENVFAVVTDAGILIVNPPSEPDLSVAADALKRLSAKSVRWVAFSGPRAVNSAGARLFPNMVRCFWQAHSCAPYQRQSRMLREQLRPAAVPANCLLSPGSFSITRCICSLKT